MRLYPIPKNIQEQSGEFFFSKNMTLTISQKYFDKKQSKLYMELFKNFTAGEGRLTIKIIEGSANTAVLAKTESSLTSLSTGGEDYCLKIDNASAMMLFNDDKSFSHAYFTLLSMIEIRTPEQGKPVFALPILEIKDSPALQFRSIHFCVFPETRYIMIKKFIRMAAFCKYSHIVLEFWGMYKYKCCKSLYWKNALTERQVRTLVSEANQMGVEIIPMLNCLGHAAQSRGVNCKHVVLDQNPQLNYLFEPNGWTWNLLNPKTVELIKKMIFELCEVCGKGKYFLIGCDESFPYGSSRLFKGKDKVEVMYNFVNDLVAELKLLDRRTIMWGDQLLWNPELPSPENTCFAESEESANALLQNLDKSILIADWQYYGRGKVEMWTAKHLRESGFEVVIAPFNNVEGLKTCVHNVFTYDYFGLMQTTWHLMHSDARLILRGATYAWSGNIELKKMDTEFLLFDSAAYFRKVLPAKGIYRNCGIRERDIEV